MTVTVITYGTFDLFHVGHLNLLNRLRALGDQLVVGVSTDEFNQTKGKTTIVGFEDRLAIVSAIKAVNVAFPECSWDQKVQDIQKYGASIFGMGSDWEGRFDDLQNYCRVVYLPRTVGISTSHIKRTLQVLDRSHIRDLKTALDLISSIVDRFE